jgi:hypothetical protein
MMALGRFGVLSKRRVVLPVAPNFFPDFRIVFN